MFVYISGRFRFALIGGNLTAHSTGSHKGIGDGIQIPGQETQLQGFLSFSRPAARAPRRACLQAIIPLPFSFRHRRN